MPTFLVGYFFAHQKMPRNFLLYKKRRPSVKMKRPRQPAVRQYTGPLALLNFVGNETTSFVRHFYCCLSRLEKELNRQRQTLKPLENQGFFRLSLLYRNGILPLPCYLKWDGIRKRYKNGSDTQTFIQR